MTALVLDCSMAVAWCFEDEATAATDTILARVRHEGAVVPALWQLAIRAGRELASRDTALLAAAAASGVATLTG